MTDQSIQESSSQDASEAVSHVDGRMDASGFGMFIDPDAAENDPSVDDAPKTTVAEYASDDGIEERVEVIRDDEEDEVDYTDIVAVRFLTEAGRLQDSMIFKARSLSPDYIVISSRKFIAPATKGVVQIVRANGKLAIVGVMTSNCEYNAQEATEEGRHRVRLQFTQVPDQVASEDLINADGRIELFDPLLENNVRQSA